MIISGRFWRKAIVTTVAAIGFVSLYEATALDSKYVARLATLHDTAALPVPGARLAFSATSYCKGFQTAAGVPVKTGILAADPEILPVGSVVEIEQLPQKYNGIYTVLDTGPEIKGREVDVYMWSCNEALVFGRRPVRLTVLRLGWNPKSTSPSFFDRLFKRPEADPPLPARPLPTSGDNAGSQASRALPTSGPDL
jgi:3D (Asp-Asp-Asp) domain-containing protein